MGDTPGRPAILPSYGTVRRSSQIIEHTQGNNFRADSHYPTLVASFITNPGSAFDYNSGLDLDSGSVKNA
ncbi:hypothetical protein EVAR_99665_1 [Eumeta japonica]|uniref:Uncharacterized protein n=1 Tax=Eumeta variegata TaxID=151549 RepID=A0A4C1S953_EUMVA|nr:hypothetical protein EVAR_99665_1 [Eumeta japonica]